VLLSSHLLREVEAIADELVVIGDGRIVAKGAVNELLAATGVLVRAGDEHALERVLAGAGLVSTGAAGGGLLVDGSIKRSAARRRRAASRCSSSAALTGSGSRSSSSS
jgi:ABC-2 type transport system ATP-binding protein